MLLGHPLVRPGKMFGYPAYYVGRNLCICLYEQGVAVKLTPELAAALRQRDPHGHPFQPQGKRTMRAWVQIILDDAAAYRDYRELLETAITLLHATQAADE